MTNKVNGLTVAITGGAQGIGAATARAFVARGARVAIGDVDEDRRDSTSAELGISGFPLDVASPESFATFVRAVEAEIGPLDVLVNNAGIMPVGPFADEETETTRRIIDINVHGVINGTRLALETMAPRGRGHIVNVASLAGEGYAPGAATYCASKHAVIGFSESIRVEVEKTGVKVSLILPAAVNTDMTSGMVGLPGAGKLDPAAVAAAIVRTVERHRPRVAVPRWLGAVMKVGRLLPAPVADALGRKLGSDRVFFEDLDRGARSRYETRARGL